MSYWLNGDFQYFAFQGPTRTVIHADCSNVPSRKKAIAVLRTLLSFGRYVLHFARPVVRRQGKYGAGTYERVFFYRHNRGCSRAGTAFSKQLKQGP